jgi:lincosamide nucleotidyltransferase A/C/D/E
MEEKLVKQMDAQYIVDLYSHVETVGIKIWIDGGWAVDALLGEQTRSHEDLDIAVEHKNLPTLKEYLASQGYESTPRDDDKMWDLVMNDGKGHEIEVHAFEFDDNGKVVEEKYWNGYSADSLNGVGWINGKQVRCVGIGQLLKTHQADKRELKEKDYKDIRVLCDKFGLEYPDGH